MLRIPHLAQEPTEEDSGEGSSREETPDVKVRFDLIPLPDGNSLGADFEKQTQYQQD